MTTRPGQKSLDDLRAYELEERRVYEITATGDDHYIALPAKNRKQRRAEAARRRREAKTPIQVQE